MFVYFLQKHDVIQKDKEFLLNKFHEVKRNGQHYYKDFLLPLFFLGFAKRDDDPEKKLFTDRYGHIKYLNGGLFYPHHIETKYSIRDQSIGGVNNDISITLINPFDPLNITIDINSDELFEIISFLNGYTWYLDNRPMKDEKDINPDVLGYIFEKYINQKELGAYYTKEDITDYISSNTIIPFIFDKLRENGFDAPDPNPIITENGDIVNIALDYIDKCPNYEALKFLYKDVLLPLSVLDPSVGSGAFLFAALNILLPIYRKTVLRLRGFREKEKDNWLHEFIAMLDSHDSQDYFLTKQIILNNLYGVDIVEEATEICKLRLFLQLASHLPNIEHIEPLPDIDFNIYSGNSLVGGLSWQDLMANYAMKLFDKYGNTIDLDQLKTDVSNLSNLKANYRQIQQTEQDDNLKQLKDQINALENRINHTIDIGTKTHPFHWFIEYNDIINRGGFDVIIGNPPFLEINEIDYQVKGYNTISSGTIHGLFVERAFSLLCKHGALSMIFPMSVVSTQRMRAVQNVLETNRNVWYSNYAWRPGKLFDQVNRALSIFISLPCYNESHKVFSTGYQKWNSDERKNIMNEIKYTEVPTDRQYYWIPKFSFPIENAILEKCTDNERSISYLVTTGGERIYYKSTGGLYWKVFTNFPPKYFLNGKEGHSSRETFIFVRNSNVAKVVIALLSSNLFWWWYTISSNLRDLNPSEIHNFPIPLEIESNEELSRLGEFYLKDLITNSHMMQRKQKNVGLTEIQSFEIKKSKQIIDQIDRELGKHYGFTDEETNFIINYDLRFRMGEDQK